MIEKETIEILNRNADRYISSLKFAESLYENKKITKEQKKEIIKKIDFCFSLNYWKHNPFIKDNALLSKVAISFLKRYYST